MKTLHRGLADAKAGRFGIAPDVITDAAIFSKKRTDAKQ
jgi:predicted transcriptional regulator